MPKEFSRTRRLNQQIQRDLSTLIHRELKDPRLTLVSITGVDVSKDLGHAKVYITSIHDEQREEVLNILAKAAGYLRHELGHLLQIRTIPQLHFYYDETLVQGSRLSEIIDKAVAADSAKSRKSGSEPDDR